MCSRLSDEVVKKRDSDENRMSLDEESYTVKLVGPYLKALNQVIKDGVYSDANELIRDALRYLFTYYDIEPFAKSPPKIIPD